MKIYFIALFVFLSSLNAFAAAPAPIKSTDLLTGKALEISMPSADQKGLVLVFLSAKCPCSDSHINLLKKMSEKYKNFKFAAVHSNADESKKAARQYFAKAQLGFPVLNDAKTLLADRFQAFKTPHAFVLSSEGEILYQGGVTNSSHADSADKNYLDEALADLDKGQKVKTPEGRTLGCVILRPNEVTK